MANTDTYSGSNIGFITVDGKMNVDVPSLLSVTQRTLDKAKQRGLETALDHAALKSS
jgi:hypothetical protein